MPLSTVRFITIAGTSPRQALPREAIVLSKKSIKAVRLPNKSIRHEERYHLLFRRKQITVPGERERHGPCAKLHYDLRKRADVFHTQMCAQFSHPETKRNNPFLTSHSPSASIPFFVLLTVTLLKREWVWTHSHQFLSSHFLLYQLQSDFNSPLP